MTNDTEDSLTLSADALAALQEFYAERDAQTEKLEKLKALVINADSHSHDDDDDERENGNGGDNVRGKKVEPTPELSIHTFTEDWNESQFWYTDEAANLLANQLLDDTSDDSVIAVVSTPSVFVALKKIMIAPGYTGPRPKTYLLEHDHRFEVFPEFVFYDYTHPFKLPTHLKGTVDRMICDPPFLSDDCQTKMAMTLRWLARPKSNPSSKPITNGITTNGINSSSSSHASSQRSTQLRVLICTGERMEALVNRLYKPLGVRTTTYEPAHEGLKNEFLCYANFECDAWSWKEAGGEGDGER